MSDYLRQTSDEIAKTIADVAKRPVDPTPQDFTNRAGLLSVFEGQRRLTHRLEEIETALTNRGASVDDLEVALLAAVAEELIRTSFDMTDKWDQDQLTGVREVAQDVVIDVQTTRHGRKAKD